jgi:hypothetical protein
VNERLHVFDGGSERERSNAAGFALERYDIVSARGAVLEHKYLSAALSAQIEQLVACAPQKAGEVEISGLESALADRAFIPWVTGAVYS